MRLCCAMRFYHESAGHSGWLRKLPGFKLTGPMREPAKGGRRRRRFSVLCVDDDGDGRDTCAFALTQKGFLAYQAADGERALRLVRELRPDVLLLDLVL